jgi:hypothetical protein
MTVNKFCPKLNRPVAPVGPDPTTNALPRLNDEHVATGGVQGMGCG